MATANIGIIGDFNPLFEAHRVVNNTLRNASAQLNMLVKFDWLPSQLFANAVNAKNIIGMYNGFWCSPGSPYVNYKAVLQAVQFIRGDNLPLFGTCAGCQHILLEFIQNVVGEKDAISDQYHENEVTSITNYPIAKKISVISKIACPIVGKKLEVKLLHSSRAARLYNSTTALEQYYCTFGLRPEYNAIIEEHGGVIAGTDDTGEVRLFELPSNKFYMATLFVPQVANDIHPLIKEFLITSANA